MSAHNQLGKTHYVCSCGVRAALEIHEVNEWLQRHSSHYSGQEHKLTELPPVPTPQDKDVMIVQTLAAIYEKINPTVQKQDVKK